MGKLTMHFGLVRLVSVALVAFAIFFLGAPRQAWAAGNVRLMTPSPQESATGTWAIKMRIDLPKEPALATVPFKFTFAKTVYYERAIVKKGEPPVLNKIRLDPPRKSGVSLDVKFSDAMGNRHNATIFDFEVRRSAG